MNFSSLSCNHFYVIILSSPCNHLWGMLTNLSLQSNVGGSCIFFLKVLVGDTFICIKSLESGDIFSLISLVVNETACEWGFLLLPNIGFGWIIFLTTITFGWWFQILPKITCVSFLLLFPEITCVWISSPP